MDPRDRRSADLTAGTKCEQLPSELSGGRISSVSMKNDSEAGGINTLLVEPQQRGTMNLINQKIIAPEQGVAASDAIRVMRGETTTVLDREGPSIFAGLNATTPSASGRSDGSRRLSNMHRSNTDENTFEPNISKKNCQVSSDRIPK